MKSWRDESVGCLTVQLDTIYTLVRVEGSGGGWEIARLRDVGDGGFCFSRLGNC